MIPRLPLALLVLLAAGFAFGAADGSWMKNVPSRDHERTSPYHGQTDAIAAGRRIFLDRCSQCHGENAEGNRKHPALKSPRVQEQATEGDLHWLLVDGNMRKGMPSRAKLPDQQIWQVITYIKSLRE